MGRNKFELADVIRIFGKQLIAQETLSPQQIKALFNIVQCRTAALGGHEEACDCCQKKRYSYNSCGDRHCPKCQGAKQALWIERLSQTTLPVMHFHLVFTLPHVLNKLVLWNDALIYKLLFASVSKTLHRFGYSHYGVESGAIAVLHTWGQNLSLHPHLHCLVPAAGYTLKGQWKNVAKHAKYLYPVHQLSRAFKYTFLDSLKRQLKKMGDLENFDHEIQEAYEKDWVVFSQAAMAKPEHVIRYLGQYTHRVAISNQRILNISKTHVSFLAKDYKDGAKQKIIKLEGVEFLRRFCLHILPKRFVKVRRYGIYNASFKRNHKLIFDVNEKIEIKLKTKKKETAVEILKRLTGFDAECCPYCKKGTMKTIREIPRIRSPSKHLPSLLLSFVK